MRCPCRLIPVMQPGRHKVNTSQLSVDLSTLRKSKKTPFQKRTEGGNDNTEDDTPLRFQAPESKAGSCPPFPRQMPEKAGPAEAKEISLAFSGRERNRDGRKKGTFGEVGNYL